MPNCWSFGCFNYLIMLIMIIMNNFNNKNDCIGTFIYNSDFLNIPRTAISDLKVCSFKAFWYILSKWQGRFEDMLLLSYFKHITPLACISYIQEIVSGKKSFCIESKHWDRPNLYLLQANDMSKAQTPVLYYSHLTKLAGHDASKNKILDWSWYGAVNSTQRKNHHWPTVTQICTLGQRGGLGDGMWITQHNPC